MYNKLHLSKKKLLAAKLLYWGGLLGSIVSVFPDGPGLRFVLCLILTLVGGLWLDSMYRCPRCGKTLFTSRLDALLLHPCDFCPKCGWQVDIEIKP